MRLPFDGQLYLVRFLHFVTPEAEVQALCAAEKWPIITHATSCQLALINKVSASAEEQTIQLAESTAFCSLLDQFERRRGRMISLGRALKQLWPTDQIRRKRFVRAVRQEEKSR